MAIIPRLRLTPKHYLQYRKVISVCLPLVLSLSATTVMEFTDRIFLANYAMDAISAALPAGIVSFLFLFFFGGIAGYATVFIAQYTGRGTHRETGSIFWQAIWFSIGAALFLFFLGKFGAKPLFALAGHDQNVQELECIYFSILCKGSIFYLAMNVLGTFFTGRGITRPVMIITIIGVIINIPLDYALIFGVAGFPEMGIAGAAIATVFSWLINALLLGTGIFTRANDRQFAVLSRWHFRKDRFMQLIRFGTPSSLQFTVDIASFAFFILLVGRIGTDALAASNIVLSINSVTFMPSLGASQGASVLVGQALGRRRPQRADDYVKRVLELLFLYILVTGILFIFLPEMILTPFFLDQQPGAEEVFTLAIPLLRIIALYLFFDGWYVVYSGALRGAGDTRYMMIAAAITGLCVMILPIYIGVEFFAISAATTWLCVVAFIFTMFCISFLRYRSGKWRTMLVIEDKK